LQELHARVGDLQAASASGAEAASKVLALAGNLCTSLEGSRDQAGIGRRFAEIIDRCCSSLEAVAAQAGPAGSSDLVVEERTEQRYTMDAERQLHRSVTGEEAPQAVSSGAGDVEFF
jgi:hypothetical protein